MLVEGPNFNFGRGRAGTIETLRQFCTAADIVLDIVPPITVDSEIVSSSRVRRLLADGQIDRATRLLTNPYRLRGLVRHGEGRGAKIGFPTANVDAIDTLLPGVGVYAGRAITDGQIWPAAINVGPNPTFGEHVLKVEVHLLDFQGSLYGRTLEVDFLRRLRDIQRFDGIDALRSQLERDVAAVRERPPSPSTS